MVGLIFTAKFGINLGFWETAHLPLPTANIITYCSLRAKCWLRDLSEISRGERGETDGGSQLFETVEKGGVMKNGPFKRGGSCTYMPMIM